MVGAEYLDTLYQSKAYWCQNDFSSLLFTLKDRELCDIDLHNNLLPNCSKRLLLGHGMPKRFHPNCPASEIVFVPALRGTSKFYVRTRTNTHEQSSTRLDKLGYDWSHHHSSEDISETYSVGWLQVPVAAKPLLER
nr:unnamed protein product [Callosobruchus analis]